MNQEYVYQVVMTNKEDNSVTHIGIFKMWEYAEACMKEANPSGNENILLAVWRHEVFERQWDMNIDHRYNLAWNLK